ncbi:MAG TPA: diacylglycerol kinase family lipid kinase, partial [Myxococcota bacterium]
TGGDFRRTFGWGTDPIADIERLVRLKRRRIDLGVCVCTGTDGQPVRRFFVNESSFGLSGDVVDQANRASKKLGARLSFLSASVKAAVAYQPKKVVLSVDGGADVVEDVSFVALGNGRYFGGSMHFAPDAVVDDGRFDTVVTRGGLGFWVKNIAGLYSGGYVGAEGVSVVKNTSLSARAAVASERIPIEVDGEQPGFLPARWDLIPATLDLLV